MAYMSQENKKLIAPQIKAVLKKYNMVGSISVENHSGLVVTLTKGDLDIIGNHLATDGAFYDDRELPTYLSVNTYHIDSHYSGEVLSFIQELSDAMNGLGSDGEANFDKSDIMTDYFHVGWYITINVGKYAKPYTVV